MEKIASLCCICKQSRSDCFPTNHIPCATDVNDMLASWEPHILGKYIKLVHGLMNAAL